MNTYKFGTLGLAFAASLALAGAAAAQSAGGMQEMGLAGAAAKGQQEPAQPAPSPQPAAQSKPDSSTDSAAKPKDKDAPGKDTTDKPATKRVFTNDDLSGMGGVSVVGAKKPSAQTNQSSANQPRNEQYWRSRAQYLHSQMEQVDRQIAQLEAQEKNAHNPNASSNGQNPPPPSAYTVGAHARGESAGANQMERLKARKTQIQEQINQLEDEARKANVPAEWIR